MNRSDFESSIYESIWEGSTAEGNSEKDYQEQLEQAKAENNQTRIAFLTDAIRTRGRTDNVNQSIVEETVARFSYLISPTVQDQDEDDLDENGYDEEYDEEYDDDF